MIALRAAPGHPGAAPAAVDPRHRPRAAGPARRRISRPHAVPRDPRSEPGDRHRPNKGLRFQLTPVYGVTIPVIVRLGNLEAKAGIANVRTLVEDGKPAIALDLTRNGDRSTYGEVRVIKAGVKEPIALPSGVALYTELGERHVALPDRRRLRHSGHRPDHGPEITK